MVQLVDYRYLHGTIPETGNNKSRIIVIHYNHILFSLIHSVFLSLGRLVDRRRRRRHRPTTSQPARILALCLARATVVCVCVCVHALSHSAFR